MEQETSTFQDRFTPSVFLATGGILGGTGLAVTASMRRRGSLKPGAKHEQD